MVEEDVLEATHLESILTTTVPVLNVSRCLPQIYCNGTLVIKSLVNLEADCAASSGGDGLVGR